MCNRALGAVRAGASDCNLAFNERNQLCNRRMMRVRDQRLRPGVGDRPQRRHALGHREREVEPRHRTPRSTLDFLGLDPCRLDRPRRRPQLGVEGFDAAFDPVGHGRERRVRLAERVAGDRITTGPDQQLELCLGHLRAGRQFAVPEGGEALADPEPGRVPRFGVVARQRRREGAVTVAGRDRAEQVLVTIPGRHHTHRNRHQQPPFRARKVGQKPPLSAASTRGCASTERRVVTQMRPGESGGTSRCGRQRRGLEGARRSVDSRCPCSTEVAARGRSCTWQVTSPAKDSTARGPAGERLPAGVLMHDPNDHHRPLRVGSLFSGYGGLDLAIEHALGAETIWFSEINKPVARIFAHHWPDAPNLGAPCSAATAGSTSPWSTSSTPRRPGQSPRTTSPSPASSPTTGPTPRTWATSRRWTGRPPHPLTSSRAASPARTCPPSASAPAWHPAHAPASGHTWPKQSRHCNPGTWSSRTCAGCSHPQPSAHP